MFDKLDDQEIYFKDGKILKLLITINLNMI